MAWDIIVHFDKFSNRKNGFAFAALASLLISACSGQVVPPPKPIPLPRPAPKPKPVVVTPAPPRPAPVQNPPAPKAQTQRSAPVGLDLQITEYWKNFPGKTGVAIRRIDGNWLVGERLNDMFPQQSVSKLWVAVAVLDRIDQGQLSLNTPVRVTYDDFTMFQSDIKSRVERNGPVDSSVAELMELAILKSDNTANDKLANLIGGPDAVRRMLAAKNLSGIRFGPGERKMQSDIAGFPWSQSYGPGNKWFEARANISDSTRRSAMNRYLADPVDGATPSGLTQGLSRLARGELLSASSTRHLLDLMARVTSGPNRLRAGVPSGWDFGHKTGTGQSLSGWATGYNDVGIMTAPDGTRYAVVVMMADTTATVPQRMQMMQGVSGAVAAYHQP